MEVHHHSHEHGKKSWRSYIWEFIMLFLAVFCGFLAEYQLEHVIEHQREKEYMKTMADDIRSDTAQLNHLIANRKERVIELDTLFDLISSNRYMTEGNKVYMLYELPYWDIFRFLPSDRTMQQLKNSGNLRVIRNQDVSDALIHYDVWIRNRKEYESLQDDIANQFNLIIEKLIDPAIIHEAKKVMIQGRMASDTLTKEGAFPITLPPDIRIPKINDADKKALLKYINEVILLYTELRKDNISEKNLAITTLELIEKEYGRN